MGYLLHSFGFGALVFGVSLAGVFLYQLWHLQLQNVGVRHFQVKRYAEAAEVFQRVLKRRPPAGIEADTRRRLADTLDVLGRTEEAAQERERIAAIISCNPQDAMTLQTQGDLLKRKERYDEACAVYSQALAKISTLDAPGRALVMAKLAIAHYEAARPAETVRWAEAALASRPNAPTCLSMERMSGVGYADQGNLEKAEQHYRSALKLSELSGNPKDIARDLGIIAGIYYKRGEFLDAIATCHKAREVFSDPSRVSYAIEAECLRDMGEFDKARAVMAQRRSAKGFDEPWTERRMLAIAALGSAWLELYADQPEAAMPFIEEAHEGLVAISHSAAVWPPAPENTDSKLLLWCDATKTLALAQCGMTMQSRQMRESVLNRLPKYAQDRATRLGVYSNLSRAAFVSGDLDDCQTLLHQYLDCRPNPVGLPSTYYWLGETFLRLGETEAARTSFKEAVAPGIDSLDARRAKARLEKIGE